MWTGGEHITKIVNDKLYTTYIAYKAAVIITLFYVKLDTQHIQHLIAAPYVKIVFKGFYVLFDFQSDISNNIAKYSTKMSVQLIVRNNL